MQVPISLKQIAAFTKRDALGWASYKTAAVISLLNIFVAVLSWGIGSSYVQKPVSEMYNTDYISFLFVGIAISNMLMPLVQGVSQLNPWTLETILMTGVNTTVFILGQIMWTYIFSMITFVPYVLIGIFFFHVHLNINIIAVILAFVISAAILLGLAMISTGLRIVTKSTDPVTYVLNTLQSLFSGSVFPVIYLDTILFTGASLISWVLPQTWVYHLCRLSMLSNPSLLDPIFWIDILIGAAFAAVLFPSGYKIFTWGLNRSKKEGTLGWY
jgi:ABC-2 type transport system permease protein